MPENWKTYKLGEITKWNSGGTPPKMKPEFWGGAIPWISARSLKGRYVSNSDLKLTEAGLKKGSRLALKGSILLLVRGSGLFNDIPVAMASKDVAYNQDVKCVIPITDVLSNIFLLYLFKGNKTTLSNMLEATSIGAGKFDMDRLFDLEINVPPLEEQKAIASILSALDDKIELNLQMNNTLEEMAMALYKHWFVDFGPFQNGNFIETELGKIPEGWEVKRLPEISKNYNTKRKPISTTEREKIQGDFPYYGATKILDYVDHFNFDGEYILLAEDGTVKTENDNPFLQFIEGKFCVSNHAHVLQGNENYSNEFLFLCLSNTNVNSIITGAVQLKINKQNLESLQFITSPINILKTFEELVIPLYIQKRSIYKENLTLTNLRDTLLPKLISGEVRVKDAEQILAAAL